MKRRMEQLINGRFEYQVPGLVFSAEKIQAGTAPGRHYRGELFFSAEDNRRIKGMITATNRRILLDKDKFAGEAIHLCLGVDVEGLEAGSVCSGDIVTPAATSERSGYRLRSR